MGVRETLNKIENMVATAKTFPFTGHILINDNDLVHYVEELRNDLPKELDKAEVIMKERDQIIEDARREAEHIRTEAERQAAAMVENSEIVLKSKQRGTEILQETQQKETAMVQAEVQADRLRMADVQVAIRLRREARVDALRVLAVLEVFFDHVLNEIRRHRDLFCHLDPLLISTLLC